MYALGFRYIVPTTFPSIFQSAPSFITKLTLFGIKAPVLLSPSLGLTSSATIPARQPRARASAPRQLAANSHSSSLLRMPYKDAQDRNSLKSKSTEGSKSDTHGEEEEEEKEAAGNEKERNPLAMNGANQKKFVPLGDKGGPEMKGTTKNERGGKARGVGSPEKKGKPPAA